MGQLTIYSRKDWEAAAEAKRKEEERKRRESETYEPKGCCAHSGKCRKCNKMKRDHFTTELYCINSSTTKKHEAAAAGSGDAPSGDVHCVCVCNTYRCV